MEYLQDGVLIEHSEDNSFVLRSSMKTPEEAGNFMAKYSDVTNTRWITWRSLPSPTKVVYRKKWVCHLNKRYKTKSSIRNANCYASVDILIKKVNRNTVRNDPLLKLKPPLPAVIRIMSDHSHPTNSESVLRMLRVKEEVKQQFFRYFSDGMTTREAMQFHECSVLADDDSSYEVTANAAINPRPRQVYSMFDTWRSMNIGSDFNPFDKLAEKMKLYTEKGAVVCINSDPAWSLVVVTSVMQRAQRLPSAKEVIFIDSTSSIESSGSTLTVLLTATKAGAVPIAVLIHDNQSAESFKSAFELLQNNFRECFAGEKAPAIFITDDCGSEKSALRSVWPSAQQLLCQFHVGRVEWRHLWASSIPVEDQVNLMRLLQKVMYAKSKEELDNSADEIFEIESEFPEFVQRFDLLFTRKEEWASLFRPSLITRSDNTHDYSETTMRILKDVIITRTKSFNIATLCDFCVCTWDKYLSRKLFEQACDKEREDRIYESLGKRVDLSLSASVKRVAEKVYTIPTKTGDAVYTVDVSFCICSCGAGKNGAFCKHLCLLFRNERLALPSVPPVKQSERHSLGILALGEKCPPLSSFFPDTMTVTNDPVSNRVKAEEVKVEPGTCVMETERVKIEPVYCVVVTEGLKVEPANCTLETEIMKTECDGD